MNPMTSSRKRTYMGLMAVGAVALVVDRCMLSDGAPASVSAEEANPATGSEETPRTRAPRSPASTRPKQGPQSGGGPHSGATEELSIPELPFPRNLKSLDVTAPVRDIFARPHSETASSSAEVTTDASGSSSSEGMTAHSSQRATFAENHRLEAVMINDGLKIAILEGRWMRVGDSIDGCALSAIEGEAAIFHCHDGDVVLSPFEKSPRGDR